MSIEVQIIATCSCAISVKFEFVANQAFDNWMSIRISKVYTLHY